jgi:hypothetical protein
MTAMTPALPPLAHEVMGMVLPGFGAAIRAAARRLHEDGSLAAATLTPEALLDRSALAGYFRALGQARIAAGSDPDAAWDELHLLSVHAFYALRFELDRRKTFWIDESLAFMLAYTRLDVRGAGLRLPFPSFALMRLRDRRDPRRRLPLTFRSICSLGGPYRSIRAGPGWWRSRMKNDAVGTRRGPTA